MEFQIVNEVSSFWSTLVPPIFLGTISLFLFWWVIRRENRRMLMKKFVDNNSDQYYLQNGVYVPKNQTTIYIFLYKISERLGLESLGPLMIIFLIVLIFLE